MKMPQRVEDSMTRYPTIISGRTSVKEALDLMERFQIRHLPVVRKDKVIGISSDRDLRKAALLGGAMTLVAPEYMTPDPYCVSETAPLSQVARIMAAKKYGCAVVTGEQGNVVGIFTTVDALEALATVLEAKSENKHWNIRDILPGNNYLFDM
jgi:CBS domain-containing protein